MLKEHNISNDFPENPQINPTSEQDHQHPDEKIGFSEMGRDLFRESDSGDVGFRLKASKPGAGMGKAGNLSSQELTLSYLCDNPKMGVGENEISGKNLFVSLEKGRYKGKEVVLEHPVEDDRWVERDFFHLNENRGSKRVVAAASEEVAEEKSEKRAKLETLNLSLGLPDVSLSLASSNPAVKSENADLGAAPAKTPTRSIQSMAPSQSDDFTGASLSYSHSHAFSHNPSCSLTRNSTENYEYSVGSRRRESDQMWYGGEGTNGSVHSRFKPLGDGVTLSNNEGHPMMNGRAVNKDGFNSLYRTNSSENLSFFPSELPARQRKDSQSVDSRGRTSEQRKVAENGLGNSDGGKGFGVIRPEEILREIVSGSISITAQVIRELPHDGIEAVKEHLKNLIGGLEKREEFVGLQRRLERRSDLTFEALSNAHEFQLEVLVTVKTGLATYISGKYHLPTPELVEVLLLLRCRNVNCKSLLPVDDCDCKICSTKKGFCSACMCPICMNFDCASNTCSWVGCDVCSHWCHAVCGMKKNLIRLSSSSKEAGATAEMHFHCIGCGHASEMFGFVRDVFESCAKDWGLETLIKELDCVRKIFQGSVDHKGKELYNRAEDLITRLNKRLISPSDACNGLLQFFERSISNISGLGSSSKDMIQAMQRADVLLPPPTPILPKPSHDTNSSITKTDTFHRNHHQSNMSKALTSEQTIEPELNYGVPKKDEFDSLESALRLKEAEARFFQGRADDARREAERYRKLVRTKNEQLEEEYASKLAKLCLQDTEEKRRKKLDELKVLENSNCDYYKMKLRMEAEIAGLLERMEATRRQWV
ncbi:protein OBERON 3 [Cinnamomum micranthum f. kanehirae]|uniref:Protein OBERON 3 n=1 Tax=Cinnamomum micranthum f. kanehirae TaxID=337451 RepID=A0A443NM26_9MAGN|nr:protein OBERON 3 [Cinnamomum micranthum f. kanehirae]